MHARSIRCVVVVSHHAVAAAAAVATVALLSEVKTACVLTTMVIHLLAQPAILKHSTNVGEM